ncbi:PAP2 superfamily protein [Enteractinococcus coprophilus]|uniref:PAP2 superfamily protein n=2 Tax=Enteractinococcus coprophilus TaxID=1027633 RepID=A0A543AM23_9MICC|nr:PAP2 superfamily protein [Enteractinococcus coprophilus]
MYSDPVHHLPEDNLPASQPERRIIRAPGSRIWAWLVLAAVMIAGFVATYRVFVVSSQGQILDHAALASAEVRLQSLHAASVSLLADLPIVVAAISAAGFLVLTLWRRRWAASLIVALTFAAANFTTQMLKVLLDRPELANGVPYYTGNSLPSGHVTFATATFAAVFLLVAPRWRSTVGLVGMIFSATVGVATFFDGWHRPADIVAAYLVVGLWTLIGGFIIYRVSADYNVISARSRAKHASLSEILLWLLAVVGVGGSVGMLFLGLGELPTHFDQVTPSLRWFMFGTTLIGGAACLVCALLTSFFRWEAGREAARDRRYGVR